MINYKSYVGPEENYDLMAGLMFVRMFQVGLRSYHTLLDVGCGSLRGGKLFIPYLDVGNYYGIEPLKELVIEGIKNEIFFFNDTATTEIYTLSLHDALPI